jgi:hypothetical protein
MSDQHDAVDAQQRRAAVFRVVEPLLYTTKRRLREHAPAFVTAVCVNSRFSIDNIASVNPSESFSMTLPVNPSVTITSTIPEKTSRPSTLPTKLMLLNCRNNGNASFVRSFPFRLFFADAHQAD